MKRIITSIMALGMIWTLVSCNGTSSSISSSNNENNSSNMESSDNPINESKNAIVIYYSATNNTKNVAYSISTYLSISIYELEPVNPYTSNDLNYSNKNSRVVKEHNDSNRHVELQNVNFDGFKEADYIFLGAPVWWQELSWVVDDFLKLNDFTGKTIIPFATSVSSDFSTSRHEELAPNATWLTGQRFSSKASSSQVQSWIDSLNLNIK